MDKTRKKRARSIRIFFIFCILISVALTSARAGDKALLNQAKQIFGPLPKTMRSANNSITADKVALGKMLFYETRISVDQTVSCVRCHPIGLYAADGLKKSIGNNCKINPRNAPTVFNAAGQISAHWIGNRTDVEDQAKQAMVGPPSFGMPSYEAVEKRLKEIRGYAPLFARAFPGEKDPVNVDNLAKAIGAFERTLVTPSRFDAFVKGNPTALAAAEKKGLKTFIETGCTNCHSGAYVGGKMYQKFGVFEPYWQYTGSKDIDEGRYAVTNNESDKYVFKVPVLRNVEMTSPYFHDGSVDGLRDVVFIMGKIQVGKSPTDEQVGEIILFLKSLTGRLPDDALRVPVLPPDGEHAGFAAVKDQPKVLSQGRYGVQNGPALPIFLSDKNSSDAYSCARER
ncbi:MAG TPA: cytochrome c peroxidase [Syntrophorhabdaceae bacterium]|nr:cytochrome c peroxidase [Syntrophorhabdaceae bacterium]